VLEGRFGNDRIVGGDGDDAIKGGEGQDVIEGGSGTDTCDGGRDSDEASGCETLIATEIGQLPVPKIAPSSRAVALTFDDGPHPIYTPQILAVLARYNVKATFFVLGWQAERYPELMEDIAAAGHSIQNHTWFHSRLPSWSSGAISTKLTRAQDTIIATSGITPRCYRPPYGSTNSRVRGVAAGLDLTEVMWDTSAADYTRPPVTNIVRRILTARGGDVILLHDAGGIRTNTVRALPYIIEGFQERGLSFETLCD